MQIAVLTFDGFNELDSFIAAAMLNRLRSKGWQAHITSPTEEVTSMNGVTVRRQKPISFAAEADGMDRNALALDFRDRLEIDTAGVVGSIAEQHDCANW